MNSAIFPAIPFETLMAARTVFGKSNFYIVTGNQANHLFDGLILSDPTCPIHEPPRTLAMLYLITIFQFAETLPDKTAVDAVRERIDWKYALHLDLNFPGVPADSLYTFREWAWNDLIGQENMRTLLSRMSAMMSLNGHQASNLEPSQVISVVSQISRLAKIWDTFNQAMEAIAIKCPDWLLSTSLPHWYERYSGQHKIINLRSDKLERYILAQEIGADGIYLLDAIIETNNKELMNLGEIQKLQQVWSEQFQCVNGKVLWKRRICVNC